MGTPSRQLKFELKYKTCFQENALGNIARKNIMPFYLRTTNFNPPDKIVLTASLTHWGRVTHICVSKLTIIGSDNGLSPDRRQTIIWTNAGILLIGPLGTNFSEIWIEILTFSFKKMRLKVSSAKWRPFCLGLNVLTASLSNLLSEFYHYGGGNFISYNLKIPDGFCDFSFLRRCQVSSYIFLDNIMVFLRGKIYVSGNGNSQLSSWTSGLWLTLYVLNLSEGT